MLLNLTIPPCLIWKIVLKVANRDINIGEVLIIEDPVAAKLHKSDAQRHCDNCLRYGNSSLKQKFIACSFKSRHLSTSSILIICLYLRECWGSQIPCSACVAHRFCSFHCLETALKSYHTFDCGGGVIEKGVAAHSVAFLEGLLTDVITNNFFHA